MKSNLDRRQPNNSSKVPFNSPARNRGLLRMQPRFSDNSIANSESLPTSEPDCLRTVVHELYQHHRPEYARCDANSLNADRRDECLIESLGLFRGSCLDKAWPPALSAIA